MSRKPRNAAALELAALQGDLGATRIRLENIKRAAERLAEDCAHLLDAAPFTERRKRPSEETGLAPQQPGGSHGSQ